MNNISSKIKWAAAIGLGLYVHDMIVKRIIKGEQKKAIQVGPVSTARQDTPALIPGAPGYVRPTAAPAATRANTPSEPPPADWQGPVKTW